MYEKAMNIALSYMKKNSITDIDAIRVQNATKVAFKQEQYIKKKEKDMQKLKTKIQIQAQKILKSVTKRERSSAYNELKSTLSQCEH
jgi:hypothetical protein